MKNFKKLTRNELKNISGGELIKIVLPGAPGTLPLQPPLDIPEQQACKVECLVNGIVKVIKVGCPVMDTESPCNYNV